MATFSIAQCFTVDKEGFTSDTIDGEVIIVNLSSGVYYSLTEVAAEVWQYIQSHFSFGQIVDAIHLQYQEDKGKITDLVNRFLENLQEESLLSPSPACPSIQNFSPAPVKGRFQPPELRKYTDLKDMVVMSRADYENITPFAPSLSKKK